MKVTYKLLKEMVREQMLGSRSFLLESPEAETLEEMASILQNKHPFKAMFMFGPAGSGKGYVLKNILKTPGDFKTSNPDDDIEEVFPKFGISMKFANAAEGGDADLEAFQQNRRKALQQASRSKTEDLISIANPIIFDTTGEDVEKMSERIRSLVKYGYDVAVMMINVPTEASVERDTGRKRTVGPTRTTGISQAYQRAVVQQRGYYESLKDIPHVTMLADDIYNNIFNLDTGELLTVPTEVTPEMLPDELNPEKNPEAFPAEKAKAAEAQARLQKWVETPVQNPGGQKLLKGMKALVRASDGRKGQNVDDLINAMAVDDFKSDQDIVDAANHLSALGGGEEARKGAIRSKKDVKGTFRGMTDKSGKAWSPGDLGATGRIKSRETPVPYRENLKKQLAEMIRDIIQSSK